MFAYSYAELIAKLSKKPNRTSVVRLNFAFLVRFCSIGYAGTLLNLYYLILPPGLELFRFPYFEPSFPVRWLTVVEGDSEHDQGAPSSIRRMLYR